MVAIIEKRDLRDFDWLTAVLAIAIAVEILTGFLLSLFWDLADTQRAPDGQLLVETDHRTRDRTSGISGSSV